MADNALARLGKSVKTAIKSFRISASEYRGGAAGMWLFNGGADGQDLHFNFENINSSLKAYADCAPINAIINLKAQAYLNGQTLLTNQNGKAKGKEAEGLIAQKYKSLLKRPNPIQSWMEFEAQHYIIKQICGYCVVAPIKPVGFDMSYATAMWNIPPWLLGLVEKPNTNLFTAKSYKDFIDSIYIVWGGLTLPLNLDEVYFFKDFTPSMFSMALPESRIRALRQPINNIIGAYDSRNILINRRGALGILANDSKDSIGQVRMTEKEKEALQSEYRKMGLRSSQWQVILTNANLKWQQMGFPTKDLMLFEEIQDDIMRICDAYGYPYRLLASEKAASYNDVSEFGKKLYQDTIIPESIIHYDQWNDFLQLGKYGLNLTKTYSHVSAMQEDEKNASQARFYRDQGLLIEFQNNLLTLNQWRELNNEEPVSGELGDLYYYECVAKGVVFGQGSKGSSLPDNSQQQNQGENQNG